MGAMRRSSGVSFSNSSRGGVFRGGKRESCSNSYLSRALFLNVSKVCFNQGTCRHGNTVPKEEVFTHIALERGDLECAAGPQGKQLGGVGTEGASRKPG